MWLLDLPGGLYLAVLFVGACAGGGGGGPPVDPSEMVIPVPRPRSECHTSGLVGWTGNDELHGYVPPKCIIWSHGFGRNKELYNELYDRFFYLGST